MLTRMHTLHMCFYWINLPIYIRSVGLCSFCIFLCSTISLPDCLHLFGELIQFQLVWKLINDLCAHTIYTKYIIQVENTVIWLWITKYRSLLRNNFFWTTQSENQYKNIHSISTPTSLNWWEKRTSNKQRIASQMIKNRKIWNGRALIVWFISIRWHSAKLMRQIDKKKHAQIECEQNVSL